MKTRSAAPNRWIIAIAGTVLQTCLGTVYAWSYFQKPLMAAYGWSNSLTAWTFSAAICSLGIAAAWGGRRLDRIGARKLATAGSLLFSLGYLLGAAALFLRSLPLLYVGYGVVGGIGLGLGYVVPVATAAKWFPDKKGLVTGMVVMGFGFGALLQSKLIAPAFMALTGGSLVLVFLCIGLLMLALTLPAASLIREPAAAAGAGAAAAAAAQAGAPASAAAAPVGGPEQVEPRQALRSRQFVFMWLLFFMNISAGIMFIAFQSPLLQDLLAKAAPPVGAAEAAAAGATLIALSSLFNGLGRFLWGGIADRIGPRAGFRLILGTQLLVFLLLPAVRSPWLFGLLVCYVLLCYGGGFGTMPSFILGVFGKRLMPALYGAVLTAWAAAGILGPQIVAGLKDALPEKAASYTFSVGAVFLALGFAATFLVKDSSREPKRA